MITTIKTIQYTGQNTCSVNQRANPDCFSTLSNKHFHYTTSYIIKASLEMGCRGPHGHPGVDQSQKSPASQ